MEAVLRMRLQDVYQRHFSKEEGAGEVGRKARVRVVEMKGRTWNILTKWLKRGMVRDICAWLACCVVVLYEPRQGVRGYCVLP